MSQTASPQVSVIESNKPLPDMKLKVGKSLIVSKNDRLFGPYVSYKIHPEDVKVIRHLFNIVQPLLNESNNAQ